MAVLVGCLALGVLTRLTVASADIINADEASYMVGASQLLSGHLPSAAFGDNTPPLIYLLYAGAQLLLGPGIASVRLLTALLIVPGTAFAVSAFYRHDRRGMTAAALLLLYGAAYTAGDMLAVTGDVVMMLPLAWSLVALARPGRARSAGGVFLAGLLVGVASLVKYEAGLWAAAELVAIAAAGWGAGRRVLRAAVAFLLGLALPALAIVTACAAAGELDGLMSWNVTHNLEYLRHPIGVGAAATRALDSGGPFLLVTSLLWYGWLRSSARGSGTSEYANTLVAATIGASSAAACLGFRFVPHDFIPLYVPLCIGAAPWVARITRWPMRLPGWAAATATLAICTGWTAVNAVRVQALSAQAASQPAAQVAARLEADGCHAGASLFVWGSAPEFYYRAGLPPASQFVVPGYPLVRYVAGAPADTRPRPSSRRRSARVQHWSRLMADLRSSRPTFIVDTSPANIARWKDFPMRDYPLLHRLITREYTHVDTVSGVDIYRRTNCVDLARRDR